MENWQLRDIAPDEAAKILGIGAETFRVFLCRHVGADISTRRRGRRWLSVRDITTIKAAGDLAGGWAWSEALPTVAHYLQCIPTPGACLVAESTRTFVADAETAGRRAAERGARVVPIGKYAAEVAAACAAADAA